MQLVILIAAVSSAMLWVNRFKGLVIPEHSVGKAHKNTQVCLDFVVGPYGMQTDLPTISKTTLTIIARWPQKVQRGTQQYSMILNVNTYTASCCIIQYHSINIDTYKCNIQLSCRICY